MRSGSRAAAILALGAVGFGSIGAGCVSRPAVSSATPAVTALAAPVSAPKSAASRPAVPATARDRVLANARQQTQTTTIYDPAYVSIRYPGGDVPKERGVCADVIVRAFRAGGVDLQKTVHEDMKANFSAYPKLWDLRGPDPNIDHRRVANLMTYFKRKKQSLPLKMSPSDYRPGDVVAWELPGGRLHIGLVSDHLLPGTQRREMIHNIGSGTCEEDILFAFKILGHYRCFA